MNPENLQPGPVFSGPGPSAELGVTMQLLCGKWKLQIISFLLKNGKTRFNALQRSITGISPRVLSKELQDLQQHNLAKRTILEAKLTAVEYELTPHGKTLEGVIRTIHAWGVQHSEYRQ